MSRVGSELFRSHFADWAGHNCADMDYLTREQVRDNDNGDDFLNWKSVIERFINLLQYDRAMLEITLAGDWEVFRPSVWQGVNQVRPVLVIFFVEVNFHSEFKVTV